MKVERAILVFPYKTEDNFIVKQIALAQDYKQVIIKIIPDHFFIPPYDTYSNKITKEELEILLKKYESIYQEIKYLNINCIFNIELDYYSTSFLTNKYAHIPLFIDYYGHFQLEEINRLHSFVNRIDYNIFLEDDNIQINDLTDQNISYFSNLDYYVSDNLNQIVKYNDDIILKVKNKINSLTLKNNNFTNFAEINNNEELDLNILLKDFYQTPAIFIYNDNQFELYLFGKKRYLATNILFLEIQDSKDVEKKLFIYLNKFINRRVCNDCPIIKSCLLNDWLLTQYQPHDIASCIYKEIQTKNNLIQ